MEITRNLKLLDGPWRIARGPEDVGKARHWENGGAPSESADVRVPSTLRPSRDASDGCFWLFTTFDLDSSWCGRHILLSFDALPINAHVWVNGTLVGVSVSGCGPVTWDASKAITEGINQIAVRVPAGRRLLHVGGAFLSGRHDAHISEIVVQPDIRRKRVLVTVTVTQMGMVRLRIAGTDYTVEGEAGRHTIEFPDCTFWSVESPVLYGLECELAVDGRVVDSTTVSFGMREFTVKDNRFCLNNKPVSIRGVTCRGFGQEYGKALELAKSAGFNLVRFHSCPVTPAALEAADRLGLLVFDDSSGEDAGLDWTTAEPGMRARFARESCHPSLVMRRVTLRAEGGSGDVVERMRELDPGRVILGDTQYVRPYRDDVEKFDELCVFQRGPVDREIALYFEHCGDVDRLSLVSGFGFGGIEDPGVSGADSAETRWVDSVQPGFAERNLDRAFGDFSAMTAAARDVQAAAIKLQVEALRLNSKLSGYCLEQLFDDDTLPGTGILDRLARPKPVYGALKPLQAPLLPVAILPKTNLVPREEVNVTVSLVNEDRSESRADLSLQVVGPTNQVLWKKKRNIKVPRGGKEIWSGTISASGSVGTHQFVVRLMQGHKIVAQNAVSMHVVEPAQPCDVDVNVVDPNGDWIERCLRFAKRGESKASIHIVPPLGNTIRAYPESELGHVLAEVHGGAVAIVFGPPEDWNELANRVDESLAATSKDATGGPLGVFHYVKIHPVFDGLPARCLMGQPYRNVIPPKTFVETGDDDIAGAFDLRPIQSGDTPDPGAWWGTDLLVRRYGSGRIVFTHLRVMEQLGEDAVADRIFVNMLRHFSRRSVPSEETLPAPQEAIDWLRREKLHRLRQWMVIGMFPNWSGKGHETAYPPEKSFEPGATYPGWYKAIQWKRWYSLADFGHCIDLQAAFSPVYAQTPRCDYGTGYAYAEFSSPARQAATVHLQVHHPTKVWLNGALIHESAEHLPPERFADHRESVQVKQGRNTVLVKVSKSPGMFQFSFDLESATRDPLTLKWWR